MKKLLLIIILCMYSDLNGMSCLPEPIDWALSNEMLSGLRFILSLGADPDGNRPDGITPLHRASTMQDPRYAQVLLAYGADATARNKFGWQPIHYASAHNKPLIIALLAQQPDVDLDAETTPVSKDTPLHLAVAHQYTAAARALLAGGASPLATNVHQQTPLHEICVAQKKTTPTEQAALVELLVQHAAKKGTHRDEYVSTCDKNGKKAAEYLQDDEQELCRAFRSQLELDKEQFYAMLKRRGLTVTQYLLKRQLGLIRPR